MRRWLRNARGGAPFRRVGVVGASDQAGASRSGRDGSAGDAVAAQRLVSPTPSGFWRIWTASRRFIFTNYKRRRPNSRDRRTRDGRCGGEQAHLKYALAFVTSTARGESVILLSTTSSYRKYRNINEALEVQSGGHNRRRWALQLDGGQQDSSAMNFYPTLPESSSLTRN